MKYIEAIFTITDKSGQAIQDTFFLQTIKDVLCELAGEAGFESFEDKEDKIAGYAQARLLDKDILECKLENFPVCDVNISYELREAEDKDWNATWEESGFEPIIIQDKYIIRDTIHDTGNARKSLTEIIIDAKQAFGTGSHETTYMIADELCANNLEGMDVLDCGCGTGILSILSSKLGAGHVVGYDIDEWSVANTKHNCEINGITNVEAIEGDSSVISRIGMEFDYVLANINRNILLSDMPHFSQAIRQGGTLILSGFYTEDSDILVDKANEHGLRLAGKKEKNNWCMLKFKRTSN